MDQEAIKKILPHRDNMLLVQEAPNTTSAAMSGS